MRLKVIYDIQDDQKEIGRLYIMPRPQSEAPHLLLERARDRKGGSKTAWWADYWRGEGCLGRGWSWRELKESNTLPYRPKYTKTAKKNWRFLHILAYKSLKTPYFRSKVLNNIYSRDVFWGIHQFKFFSLLKPLWSYTCSKFRKSYIPPAARIRVKDRNQGIPNIKISYCNPFKLTKQTQSLVYNPSYTVQRILHLAGNCMYHKKKNVVYWIVPKRVFDSQIAHPKVKRARENTGMLLSPSQLRIYSQFNDDIFSFH